MENNKVVSESADEKKEVTPKVETVVYGTVVNCKNLNIRKRPTQKSDAIQIIEVDSMVQVDKSKSTSDFYKVCTATGAEGYCMKQYVKIQ